MPILILSIHFFIKVIPFLGRSTCKEKEEKKERDLLSGFVGEFLCAKGSSCQQKELQLKSWHCSFGTDEVHKPHERTKEKR